MLHRSEDKAPKHRQGRPGDKAAPKDETGNLSPAMFVMSHHRLPFKLKENKCYPFKSVKMVPNILNVH